MRGRKANDESVEEQPVFIYGELLFVLGNETGSLSIVAPGSCNPDAAEALLKEGDRVRVTGLAHAPKSEAPRDIRVPTP